MTHKTLSGQRPIIIAHRGLCGHFPEHSEPAYRAAIAAGADFIEPDLVMTKDGVPVVRHDRYLSASTNVSAHPEFADRLRPDRAGHLLHDDWFAEDFTLAELKTLRTRQAFPGRTTEHDDIHPILSFEEVVQIALEASKTEGRLIGIYPETKTPGHHAALGLDMQAPLLEILDRLNVKRSGIPVFIQSFEPEILREIRSQAPHWPLIQLLPQKSGGPLNLVDIAKYADGIGPYKMMGEVAEGGIAGFIQEAHTHGLAVHPYTFRDDHIGHGYTSIDDEFRTWFAAGVDGLFTDFANTAFSVRNS